MACDIKDPKQNIEWTSPEGGGGSGDKSTPFGVDYTT
jgi:hypothetical protein